MAGRWTDKWPLNPLNTRSSSKVSKGSPSDLAAGSQVQYAQKGMVEAVTYFVLSSACIDSLLVSISGRSDHR